MSETLEAQAADPYAWMKVFTGYKYPDAFVEAGYRYATDGRIAIRVPAPGEQDTPNAHRPRNVASVFSPVEEDAAPWPAPNPAYRPVACWCRDEDRPFSKGRCPRCGGSGLVRAEDYQDVQGRHIGIFYHGLIRSLPNVRVGPVAGYEKPLPFRFDGGEGVVLGLEI